MTCRCSSPEEHEKRAIRQAEGRATDRATMYKEEVEELKAVIEAMTVKAGKYTVVDAEQVGDHLVMQVKYPSCNKCEFDGVKTMVFLNTSMKEALCWNKIDPHFRRTSMLEHEDPTVSPSPSARFLGNSDGWADAVAYAHGK